MSMGAETIDSADGDRNGAAHQTGTSLVAGRFTASRVLNEGAGVQTLLAVDRSSGADVIIKRTEAKSAGTALAMRLAHEVEVLRELSGPDGARFLVAHGTDEGWIWLAQ